MASIKCIVAMKLYDIEREKLTDSWLHVNPSIFYPVNKFRYSGASLLRTL